MSVCSQGSNNSLQQVKEGEQRRSPSLWKQLCSWCHAAVKWGGRIAVTMFYVFTPPYQISFESQVSFNWLYASCYTVDALVLIDRSSSLVMTLSPSLSPSPVLNHFPLLPPSRQCPRHPFPPPPSPNSLLISLSLASLRTVRTRFERPRGGLSLASLHTVRTPFERPRGGQKDDGERAAL